MCSSSEHLSYCFWIINSGAGKLGVSGSQSHAVSMKTLARALPKAGELQEVLLTIMLASPESCSRHGNWLLSGKQGGGIGEKKEGHLN